MLVLMTHTHRSFAKKEEVENMIASEIARLGLNLRQERDIEIARAVSERGTICFVFILRDTLQKGRLNVMLESIRPGNVRFSVG